ncbi:SHQ1-domain-containing protein [Gonapodya prolifera JEL478]|uniref:SHQ1-domain-containing protein n=1 Tax=Gonapodya prolifera (strain JEL478) TaxID=1344416 RepID=A0A139A2V7_GONPJ|nr:SHQ1-domain-containing protein [Gonapodya prolifera JEL478]|eukprot:KXS10988.1 SHQ1-domain-containing protein [Gonapodya prolifera JEL478]
MLQPKFRLSQDAHAVTLVLHVPFIRTQEIELDVSDGNIIRFHAKPYFLRIHLPGRVAEEEERHTANYDIGSGELTVRIPKECPGEDFKDLDLLTKLLVSPKSNEASSKGTPRPAIEVLGSDEVRLPDSDDEDSDDEDGSVDIDWSFPQSVPEDEKLLPQQTYGFNSAYAGVGPQLREVAFEVVECASEEIFGLPKDKRTEQRREMEDASFDEDHYIADLANEQDIAHIFEWNPPWADTSNTAIDQSGAASSDTKTSPLLADVTSQMDNLSLNSETKSEWDSTFTEKENRALTLLPKKEYILHDKRATYLSLIDILFAYCYDLRTTEGEHTVESAWTICKISSTLCWDARFPSLPSLLATSFRRSLAYPLYRSWRLSLLVLDDVRSVLKLGKRAVLKCLLDMKEVMDRHEAAYLVGRLWVDDYCVWVQSASDKRLRSLYDDVTKIRMVKSMTDWPLNDLDEIAKMDS